MPATYIVFGASGGIGSALSRRLAAKGAHVMLAGRNHEKLTALAAELNAETFPLDATVSADVDACLAHTIQRYGSLDGIAHCVGSLVLKSAHATTDGDWSAVISTNLTSAFLALRASVRVMNKGSIVLTSSAAARTGLASHEAIAAAKAGIIGLTLSAAATYAPRGIRVNCVAPGLTRTPLTARVTAHAASLDASQRLHALGRLGEPDDVASAIDWLLDPANTWVTGQVLGVDGGLGSVRSR